MVEFLQLLQLRSGFFPTFLIANPPNLQCGILGPHVAAPYETHVPPEYSTGAPTFTILAAINVPYEVDQYAEMEKDAHLKEEASINAQLQGVRKALKSLQVTRGMEGLDYDDLSIHPDIDIPVGYKPPMFDIFDRKGDPHVHLRACCDKVVGVGRNEKLRMKLFIRSLFGEALT